jgi:hypothetical protein
VSIELKLNFTQVAHEEGDDNTSIFAQLSNQSFEVLQDSLNGEDLYLLIAPDDEQFGPYNLTTLVAFGDGLRWHARSVAFGYSTPSVVSDSHLTK